MKYIDKSVTKKKEMQKVSKDNRDMIRVRRILKCREVHIKPLPTGKKPLTGRIIPLIRYCHYKASQCIYKYVKHGKHERD